MAFVRDHKAPRSVLRCPACGLTVVLPARVCSHCQADLRTAYLKKPPRRRWPVWAFSGAALCLLAVAGHFLYLQAPWRQKTAGRAPAGPVLTDEERSIAAAPANFQRLAEENPLLLLPYIYVYRAKTAVVRYQGQFENRYRQMDEIIGASGDVLAFQRASPGQRQLMLKELMALPETAAHEGRP